MAGYVGSDGRWVNDGAALAAAAAQNTSTHQRAKANWNKPDWHKFVLAMGAPLAAGAAFTALPSILSGGGAAAAGPAGGGFWSGVTAPTFGAAGSAAAAPSAAGAATAAGVGATKGFLGKLGSILSSPAVEVGAQTGLALYGQRSQNKSNDRARADALAREAKMLELEQQRLAMEAKNADLDREDARALNAAIQEMERRRFALEQERASFERGVIEADRAYLEPYRRTSDAARRKLASILGLG